VQEQGGAGLVSSFARLQQLTRLPRKIPHAASIARNDGTVDAIHPTPTGVDVVVSGVRHHVGKDPRGMPLHVPLSGTGGTGARAAWAPPKVGQKVAAGDLLSDPSRTVVNPHDLYAATRSMPRVQEHLAREMHDLYKDEGVRRRAIETVVKAMGDLTRIDDPGDHPELLRGEHRRLGAVQKLNADLLLAGKRPIAHTPVLKGIDVLPLSLHEDWMAKLQHQKLRTTLQEAAATLGVSSLHGTHPVPGMAYGAEFGLNSTRAVRVGAEHVADVPAHVY
jgi:hypothetical protein